MDEPTAFLDVDKELRVIEIVRRLRDQGRNIILVLHDVNLLYRICNNVILLKNGRIVAAGRRDEVMTLPNLRETYSVEFRELTDGGPYRFAPANFSDSG